MESSRFYNAPEHTDACFCLRREKSSAKLSAFPSASYSSRIAIPSVSYFNVRRITLGEKKKDETDSQDIDKRAFDQILSATNFPALTETKEKKNGTRENTPIVFIPGTFLATILARTLLSSLFGDGPTGIK